ncbi:hypothetical protein U0070_014140, partial [Myodes glareolus]
MPILRSWKEYDLAIAIINYGKKMLDITSGCKSLFGNEQDETGEEVKRNESLIGVKRLKCKDNVFCKKTPKSPKKFKAIVIEIGRSIDGLQRRKKKRKETLKDFFVKNPSIFELSEHERKRFHQILLEELPWRAQINLYLASAHFHLFLLKLTERTKMRFSTSHSIVSFRSCDPNLFSLYHSGVMLPKAKLTVDSYKAMLDVLMATKRKKPNQPTAKEDIEDFSAFWNSKSEDNVSKIKPNTISESESQLGICINDREKDRALNWGLDHFMKIFSCCRRAMVLAYRGGYWTLLQNCCRAFWNFVRELQILLKQAVDNYKTFPISQDGFLCICVLPFNLGAELLIDMLIKLQSTNSIK